MENAHCLNIEYVSKKSKSLRCKEKPTIYSSNSFIAVPLPFQLM